MMLTIFKYSNNLLLLFFLPWIQNLCFFLPKWEITFSCNIYWKKISEICLKINRDCFGIKWNWNLLKKFLFWVFTKRCWFNGNKWCRLSFHRKRIRSKSPSKFTCNLFGCLWITMSVCHNTMAIMLIEINSMIRNGMMNYHFHCLTMYVRALLGNGIHFKWLSFSSGRKILLLIPHNMKTGLQSNENE